MAIKKEQAVFGALAAVFLLILIYEFLFFDPHMADQHMAHHNDMHSFMAGRTSLSLLGFNLLFWILLFALLYLFIRQTPQLQPKEPDAVKILKERYAKGEISQEEYLKIFKDIKEK